MKKRNNVGDKISCLNYLTVGSGNIVCFYCMNKWNCEGTGSKGKATKFIKTRKFKWEDMFLLF